VFDLREMNEDFVELWVSRVPWQAHSPPRMRMVARPFLWTCSCQSCGMAVSDVVARSAAMVHRMAFTL
jgi:hypothetical protein